MQDIIKKRIVKLKTNILRARYNLLFMVVLSVINVMTIFSGRQVFIPFSSSVSNYATYFGMVISKEHGENLFGILGIAISVLMLGIIVFCYFKSKNNTIFFVIALGIIVIDTLLLLITAISGIAFGESIFIVDVLVHIMTIIFLVSAIKSSKELLGLINENPITEKADENELDHEANQEIAFIDRYEDEGGIVLLSGEYEDLDIFVGAKDNVAELFVNDISYDSVEIADTKEFELSALVGAVNIKFQYKRNYSGETSYLYANDYIVDSFAKDFL